MTSFDPRDHRKSLKLRRRERDRSLYENRDDVHCPVCDRPFERVLGTEQRQYRLHPDGEVCLLREPDRLFLFSH